MEGPVQELGAHALVLHTITNEGTNSSNPVTTTSSSDIIAPENQSGSGLAIPSPIITGSTPLTSLALKKSSVIATHSTTDFSCETQGSLRPTSIANDVVALMDEERANDYAHYTAQFIPLVETITRLSEEKEQWDKERNDWEDHRKVLEYEKGALRKVLEEEKQRAVEERLRVKDEQKMWIARLKDQEKCLDGLRRKREEERLRHIAEINIKEKVHKERVREMEAKGVEGRVELQQTLDATEAKWDAIQARWDATEAGWNTERQQMDQTCKLTRWQLSTERDKLTVAKMELAEVSSELSKVVKQNGNLQERLTELERDLRQRDERFNKAMDRWKGDLDSERMKHEEEARCGLEGVKRFQDQVKTLEAMITHSTSAEVACRAELDVLSLEKGRMGADLTKAQVDLRQERIRAGCAEKMAEDAKREGNDVKACYDQQLSDMTRQHKMEHDEANNQIMKHRALLSETEARDRALLHRAKVKQERTDKDLKSARNRLAESNRDNTILATKLGQEQAQHTAMEEEVERLQAIAKVGELQRETLAQEMSISQEDAKRSIRTLMLETDHKISTLQSEINKVTHNLADAEKIIKAHEATSIQLVTQRAQLENQFEAVNTSLASQKEEFIDQRTKMEEAHSLVTAEKKVYKEGLNIVTAEYESLKKVASGFVILRIKLINDHKRLLEAKTQDATAAKQMLQDEHQKAFKVERTKHQTETKALRETLRCHKEEFANERTKLEETHSLLITERDKCDEELKAVTAESESHKKACIIERVKVENGYKQRLETKIREAAAARQRLKNKHQKALEVELTRHQAEIEALREAHQETVRGLHQAMSSAVTAVFGTAT